MSLDQGHSYAILHLNKGRLWFMREIVSLKIDSFYEYELPKVSLRKVRIPFYDNLIDVIIGMRRSGKTYICYQKIKELLDNGILKKNILYFNFDDDRLFGFSLTDFDLIIQEYFKKFPENKKEKCYFFLDEIQNISGWELFIRRILDTENIKICITGSSAKQLSKEVASTLRGRGIATEVFPLSFEEFINFHEIRIPFTNSFGGETKAILQNAFDKYFLTGGFPEIQKMFIEDGRNLLQTYIDLTILRDVIERYKITNIFALQSFTHEMISRPASQLSIRKVYGSFQTMGIKCSKDILYNFLNYLNDCYLLFSIDLHDNSYRRKLVNPSKIYAIDHGLVRASSYFSRQDNSHLFENMVFINLRRYTDKIEYYLTKEGFEIDFLVSHPDSKISLFQVYVNLDNSETLNREIRALKSAMKELNVEKGTIITLNDEKNLENESIEIVPAWKWFYTSGK